jgi:hypothetical protein
VKSRGAYDEFLNLWKAADADIPILQQAKAPNPQSFGDMPSG